VLELKDINRICGLYKQMIIYLTIGFMIILCLVNLSLTNSDSKLVDDMLGFWSIMMEFLF